MLNKKWLIILAAVVLLLLVACGILTYRLISVQEDLKAMRASYKILEQDLEADRERNRLRFDTLERKVTRNLDSIRITKSELAEFSEKRRNIKIRSNENKDRILRIDNADSLSGILSRRYR